MTKRELINHLESLEVPDGAIVLNECTEYDYDGHWSYFEPLDSINAPQVAYTEFQSPVIVIGDVDDYRIGVQNKIARESKKFCPETESEAAIRLKREERDKTRRLASTRNWDNGLVQAYHGDIARRITDKVFASYLKP